MTLHNPILKPLIKNLIVEATEFVDDPLLGVTRIMVNPIKLAELVINECIKAIDGANTLDCGYAEQSYRLICQNDIKQHFWNVE